MTADALAAFKVIHYTANRVTLGLRRWRRLSDEQYHEVRNGVVRVCRRHGTVGPLGERLAPPTTDNPLGRWEKGSPSHPTYYILTDQLNDLEPYVYLETESSGVHADWLVDLASELRRWRGWRAATRLTRAGRELRGYLIVAPDKLLVTGPLFQPCTSAFGVIQACQEATPDLFV